MKFIICILLISVVSALCSEDTGGPAITTATKRAQTKRDRRSGVSGSNSSGSRSSGQAASGAVTTSMFYGGNIAFPAVADDTITYDVDTYIGVLLLVVRNSNPFTKTTFKLQSTDALVFANQKLYVFLGPYEDAPGEIDNSNYYAKSETSDGYTFDFPPSVTFNAGIYYYFYFANPIRGMISIDGNNDENELIEWQPVSNYYLDSLAFTLESSQGMTTGIQNGGAHGDPLIYGFHDTKFWFNGHVGGIFNIYNDEYVNVNSLFAMANEKNGTVMEEIAIELSGYKISFNIHNPHNENMMIVNIDGANKTISSSSILHLERCVDIGMKPKYLSIRTPLHDMKIKLGRPTGDGYITVHHLDFDINPPKHTQVGGVIGQTANLQSERDESLFSVSSIFGSEKSLYYRKSHLYC